MIQTGEEESSGARERSKGVRHDERVTGRAGWVLCLMEAWIWMYVSGRAESSGFECGREMVGDETVVRRFTVTLISSGLWATCKTLALHWGLIN